MKSLFVTSMFCAVASLLAIVGLSAVTIVPGPGAEGERTKIMITAGAFFIGWLAFGNWIHRNQRRIVWPPWLSRMLVAVGILYCVGVLLLTLG
jgi:hypothetical protein